MTQEDALFKMADALIGVMSESWTLSRYISDEDFDECLDACKEANKKRYVKEIVIYL